MIKVKDGALNCFYISWAVLVRLSLKKELWHGSILGIKDVSILHVEEYFN
jgi:hypothetical protein